ncbi:hypothetical protein OA385_01805 [Paracoccaceae bacterium]|nr:hypothetical protein [Paracoccaceae bacterium]
MTVIATNTVRPHLGKAKLQLNNMLEVTKAFGDMGITARVSRVVFGQNAGCLVFSTFASNFSEAMTNTQKVFSSEMWAKVQMRLDDNPAGDIVMPLNLVRVAAGEMKPTHRVMNFRWYLMKKDKMPMAMEMFEEVKGMCEKVDVNPVLLTPVTGDNMSSMIIAYGATSLEASGKAFDQMGMTEEFQSLVSRAAEVGELHNGWMTVPADQ